MTEPLQHLVARADHLLGLGRDVEAIEAAREGLRTEPAHPQLLLVMALAHLGLDQHEAALQAADRAVAAAPDAARPLAVRGWALHCSGRRDEAAEALRAAVALDPADPYVRRLLVSTLSSTAARATTPLRRRERTRLAAEAREHVAALSSLAPADPATHNAAAHLAIVERDPVSARLALDRALQLDPNDARAHHLAGVVAEMHGDLGRAGDHYLESARLDPRNRAGLDRIREMSIGWGLRGLVIFYVARTIQRSGDLLGATTGRVLVALGGAIAFAALVVAPWVRARRALSPAARAALARDRALRRRRPPLRPVVTGLAIVGVTVALVAAVPDEGRDDRPHVSGALRILGVDETDPVTGVPGRRLTATERFVPDCAALVGRPVTVRGIGADGCALRDLGRTIIDTRRITCGGTVDLLSAGRDEEAVHGPLGGIWVAGPPPACG